MAGRVAVLGTGIMGAPMARNIVKAGFDVTVWNRNEEKARALAEDGADVAATPAEAVEGAGFVVTMLADAEAVESVMSQAADAVPDDAIWLQTSTVGLEGIERLAKLAEEHGITMVDSPVSGTRQPAEQGELVVLASGPREALERARPVFEAIGSKTTELGEEPGEATKLKLVLNSWLLVLVEGLAETIAFAEGIGADPKRFLGAIEGGPLGPAYAQVKGNMMLEREFPTAFPLHLALKDARLVREAAERAGIDTPLIEVVIRQMERSVEQGHGEEDMAATFEATARE